MSSHRDMRSLSFDRQIFVERTAIALEFGCWPCRPVKRNREKNCCAAEVAVRPKEAAVATMLAPNVLMTRPERSQWPLRRYEAKVSGMRSAAVDEFMPVQFALPLDGCDFNYFAPEVTPPKLTYTNPTSAVVVAYRWNFPMTGLNEFALSASAYAANVPPVTRLGSRYVPAATPVATMMAWFVNPCTRIGCGWLPGQLPTSTPMMRFTSAVLPLKVVNPFPYGICATTAPAVVVSVITM